MTAKKRTEKKAATESDKKLNREADRQQTPVTLKKMKQHDTVSRLELDGDSVRPEDSGAGCGGADSGLPEDCSLHVCGE